MYFYTIIEYYSMIIGSLNLSFIIDLSCQLDSKCKNQYILYIVSLFVNNFNVKFIKILFLLILLQKFSNSIIYYVFIRCYIDLFFIILYQFNI